MARLNIILGADWFKDSGRNLNREKTFLRMLRANRILKSGSLRVRCASMTSSSDISNEKPPLAETMGKPVGTVDGVKFEKINVTIPGKGLLDDVHCMVNKDS